MSHSQLLDSHVLGLLPRNLNDMVVLDVGCGFGEWGFLMRTRKRGHPYLIGIDIWRPYLKKANPLGIYDELIQVRLPHIPLKDKSIDIAVACEVLEHLHKDDGYGLIAELERITEMAIILSTPLNWPQEEIWGNPYETHVTEWSITDFARQGYETKIVRIFPKTFEVIDRVRRLIFRLPPTPRLVVARKQLNDSVYC
jgi:SAM-dependent methyltransferase